MTMACAEAHAHLNREEPDVPPGAARARYSHARAPGTGARAQDTRPSIARAATDQRDVE